MRLVCLAAEAADIVVGLGAADCLVGVSSFARLPHYLKDVPRIGGFSTPALSAVLALDPDLVIATSDVQADAVAELLRSGLPVLALNPHRLGDVPQNIHLIGAALGLPDAAGRFVDRFCLELESLRCPQRSAKRPCVFFEEWPEPMVSGIGWVGDLIEHLGGIDAFPELRDRRRAEQRRVDPNEVVKRQPDLIVASWCGKKVVPQRITARSGWAAIPAVRHGRVWEIPSDDILQAGPRLLRGARALSRMIGKSYGES